MIRLDNIERSWHWRRRRNRDHGYWEDIVNGVKIGPIPLDENGRALLVPRTDDRWAIGNDDPLNAIIDNGRCNLGHEWDEGFKVGCGLCEAVRDAMDALIRGQSE